MAHGLADILASQTGSEARGPAHGDAANPGVAECGNYDTHARTCQRFHSSAWTSFCFEVSGTSHGQDVFHDHPDCFPDERVMSDVATRTADPVRAGNSNSS